GMALRWSQLGTPAPLLDAPTAEEVSISALFAALRAWRRRGIGLERRRSIASRRARAAAWARAAAPFVASRSAWGRGRARWRTWSKARRVSVKTKTASGRPSGLLAGIGTDGS